MRSLLLAIALALAACDPNPPPAQPSDSPSPAPTGPNPSPIRHIVVVIQENRTVDNLFQFLPGANTQNYGYAPGNVQVPLQPQNLVTSWDIPHTHGAFKSAYDSGANDGWNNEGCGSGCPANAAYSYVPQSQVQPYYDMATQYVFANAMFETSQGPSFPAHQYAISGTSTVSNGSDLRVAENSPFAGCDAPTGTTVQAIDGSGSEAHFVFPCFKRKSIFGEADTAGVTWHYYQATAGTGLWNAPDAIEKLCPSTPCSGDPDFANVIVPSSQFLTDIGNGTLSQITYITPTAASSDHAGSNDGSGPSWVTSVVNAVGQSPFWSSTAIFIFWDDWGGWYDHVTPTVRNSYELGYRVPLLVISPYAPSAGYISTVPHEYGSILHFIEETFNLPSMGTTDAGADDLSDCFNFLQAPTTFAPFTSPLKSKHFLLQHDPRPVDD